jgi:hypothetical protein
MILVAVAAAAAIELNIANDAVLKLEVDVSRANAARFICEFFSHF